MSHAISPTARLLTKADIDRAFWNIPKLREAYDQGPEAFDEAYMKMLAGNPENAEAQPQMRPLV